LLRGGDKIPVSSLYKRGQDSGFLPFTRGDKIPVSPLTKGGLRGVNSPTNYPTLTLTLAKGRG